MSVFDKLHLDDADMVVVLNAPLEFDKKVAALIAIEKFREVPNTPVEWAIAFVATPEEVEAAIQPLAERLEDNAVLWMAYPKPGSPKAGGGVDGGSGWDAVDGLGFERGEEVNLDPDWTAVRFHRTQPAPEAAQDPAREAPGIHSEMLPKP